MILQGKYYNLYFAIEETTLRNFKKCDQGQPFSGVNGFPLCLSFKMKDLARL